MSGCIYIVTYITVTANLTSICCIAFIFTIRCSYNWCVFVACCRNNSFWNNTATYWTVNSCFSVFCTSCVNCFCFACSMTCGGDFFCYCITANWASFCFWTVSSTSSISYFPIAVRMTKCINIGVNITVTTVCTSVSCITFIFTIRCSHCWCVWMTCCRNCCCLISTATV